MTAWAKERMNNFEKMPCCCRSYCYRQSGLLKDFAALSLRNGSDYKMDLTNHRIMILSVPIRTFIIGYGGTLSNDRNPELFWQVIGELQRRMEQQGQHLRIQFTGAIDPAVYDSIRDADLNTSSSYEALPHDEYLRKIRSSDILLLIGAKDQPGVLTGKLFEYLSFFKYRF